MYIFISEEEYFTNFKDPSKLFWLEEEIVYGDWTGGIFGDGSYVKKGEIPVSKVSVCICLPSVFNLIVFFTV